MNYSWAYKCGKCGALVEVEDVQKHTDAHRTDKDWKGYLAWERVDK
jgi:hypothetical protein